MFTSLEIENFKAFGTRTKIPLAPITLIFGENSAGKSSILQCLNLLKQTVEGRNTNAALCPSPRRAENKIVDLGSFQDILFNHDLKRSFKVKLAYNDHNSESTFMEFSFNRPSLDKDASLEYIFLFEGGEPIAKFEAGIPLAMRSAGTLERFRTVSCSWITSDPDIWEDYFKYASKHRKTILQAFQQDSGNTKKQNSSSIHELRLFFEKDFDLESFIKFFTEYEKEQIIALKNFLPVVEKAEFVDVGLFFNSIPELKKIKKHLLPDFTGRLFKASNALQHQLKSLFPLAPSRCTAERWYAFNGTSPNDVGYWGEDMPALLYRNRDQIQQKTNEWLEKLEIGYQLNVRGLGHGTKEFFDLRLTDTRQKTKVDVGLSDVGFGISQVLPFIVQSIAGQYQTISIEQPEVHIHPRLQADLGDMLSFCIKPPNENQFIIETHSEHLVLRLQRLVRLGQLRADDVSIIYITRGREGSKAMRLRIDREGEFIDDWPGGFFEERLREFED
jgi:predicted ATPase